MAYTDTYPPDYKKQYESALGTVKNTYQTQRDALSQQQSALPYTYQAQKNQVYAQGNQTARALDETNAQRGLYNSGTARTDLARTYASRDTGINDINNQQGQATQTLQNQMNQLGSQEATAIAGLQGQEGQDMRNYDLQQASLTGNLGGQQTLAGQNTGLQQAAITGMFNGAPTMASQAQTADIANMSQSQKLAFLQALQNYGLGKAQVTDTFDAIRGFNYGDYMKQLLAQLGAA